MDPATLATTAVAAVASDLLGLGKVAAEESAKSAGKGVFDWVKAKLTGASAKEAVEDFEKAPDKPLNARGLQVAIEKALDGDAAAIAELQKLLADAKGVSGGQTAIVSGPGAKVGQADRGSSVNIS